MARVLFARGAKGEIIRKMQQRLTEAGFSTQGVDGDYGSNTRNAVIAFQNARGLGTTGEVDVTTFETLMGTPTPDIKERSLQLTAAFEGHDFTLAQGNFDGAGITWGVIGFTLNSGELRRIILRVNDRHPALVRAAFQSNTDQLLDVLNSSMSRQMAFADSISLGTSKERLAEPWRSAFRRFGEFEAVQALQLELADRDFFQPARRTAERFNLTAELGIALAFDIHVQNGGIKEEAREQIRRELAARPVSSERELRVVIGTAVADNARPRFREDVRSRKITIANGSGRVHGATFVLSAWGLAELPSDG
jgi:peptidoglycan hydrolase-like protein with peptidoglycan-binding domain